MRLAVISDIHGNLLALDAVLEDIAARGVDLTVNLGDVLSGALQPRETAERLMPLNFPTVRGNHERQLLTFSYDKLGSSDVLALSTITDAQRSWLASFPATLELPEGVLLVHGSPTNDLMYLLESIDETGVRPATIQEANSRVEETRSPVILCGHTHLARSLTLPGAG